MKKILRLSVLISLVSAQLGYADTLTDQARILLDQGKAAEAYQLLEPVETARSGDVAFDLLFGVTAIDAGKLTRGVFALERVLAMEPNNALARAEIARAYLALGETKTARAEFETVQKQGVPPEVSAAIDRYLAAVERLDYATQTTVRGYLESAIGYDTNVNVGPNKSAVAIPSFGGLSLTLADDSKASGDWFDTFGGGFTVRRPVNEELALVGGMSGVLRHNLHKGQFDNVASDANLGAVLTRDKHTFSLTGQYSEFTLNDSLYRAATGATGQWQYAMSARDQVSAFGQYSDVRYPSQSIRNAERWVGGGAYAHVLQGGAVLFGSAYVVSEKERAGGVPYLGHTGYGARVGGQMNWDANTVLFANVSAESRRYGGVDPSFLTIREDLQGDFTVGVNYTPAKDWKLTPKVGYSINSSNIALNTYHRELASFTVRRDF